MTTYEITNDGRSIKCLVCGLTSWHPEDVRQLYCGNCHEFHALKTCDCPIAFPEDSALAMQVHRYDCPLNQAKEAGQ